MLLRIKKKYTATFLAFVLVMSTLFPNALPVFAAETKTYDFGLFQIDVDLEDSTFEEGLQGIDFSVTSTMNINNQITFSIGDASKTLNSLSNLTEQISIENVNFETGMTEITLKISIDDGNENKIEIQNNYNVHSSSVVTEPNITVTSTNNQAGQRADYKISFTITDSIAKYLSEMVNDPRLDISFKKKVQNSSEEFLVNGIPFENGVSINGLVLKNKNISTRDDAYSALVMSWVDKNSPPSAGDRITVTLRDIINPIHSGTYEMKVAFNNSTSVGSVFTTIEGESEIVDNIIITPNNPGAGTITDYVFDITFLRDTQHSTFTTWKPLFEINFHAQSATSKFDLSESSVEVVGFNSEDITFGKIQLPSYDRTYIMFKSDTQFYRGDKVKVIVKNVKNPIIPSGPGSPGYGVGIAVEYEGSDWSEFPGQRTVGIPAAEKNIDDFYISPNLQKLEVTPKNATIRVGETQQYTAIATYSNNTTKDVTTESTWNLADTNIASIDKGKATGTKKGTTEVTATFEGLSDTATLIVEDTPVTLTKLEVTPETATIKVGEIKQYEAIATYSDGTTKNVTDIASWGGENINIAEPLGKGKFKGITPGTIKVAASFNGQFDNADLIVISNPTPIKLEVTPKTATIKVGENQQYTATATYSDNTTKDVTTESSWIIVDSDIANINKGNTKGLKKGTTQVTATFEGLSDTATLNVEDLPVPPVPELPEPTITKLEVTPKTATIKVGEKQQYIATATYTDGSTKNVTTESEWSVSSDAIANINQGLATGKVKGTTLVTAQFNGLSDSATLIVVDNATPTPVNLIGLEVTPKTATIYVGETQQYEANALYSDGTKKDVTAESNWKVQDTNIADINNGSAKGKKTGTTSVTATFEGLSDSADLIVIKRNRPSPSVTLEKLEVFPKTATIFVGEKQQYKATATYSNGIKEDVTTRSVWTISKEFARIDQDGVAEGLKEGKTPVTAEFQGLTDKAELIVKKPDRKLIDLKITPKTAEIFVGETQQYIATAYYDNGSSEDVTNRSIWSISNEDLANINNHGLAIGIKKGRTTVVAEYLGLSDDAVLIIKEKTVPRIPVELNPEEPDEPKKPETPQDLPTPLEPNDNPTPNIQVPGVPKTGDGSRGNTENVSLIAVIATLLSFIVFYRRKSKMMKH